MKMQKKSITNIQIANSQNCTTIINLNFVFFLHFTIGNMKTQYSGMKEIDQIFNKFE